MSAPAAQQKAAGEQAVEAGAVGSAAAEAAALPPPPPPSPPAAIVVEHHDVFRMVTGNDLDSARSLDEFPALRELIETELEHAARIGDFDVYLRRTE